MFAFNYTPHIETQNVELVITFVTTNIMPKTNYKSHKPQNGPTLHEHVVTCMKTTKIDDKEIGLNLNSKHKTKGPKQ
jgi:hypothetical protein